MPCKLLWHTTAAGRSIGKGRKNYGYGQFYLGQVAEPWVVFSLSYVGLRDLWVEQYWMGPLEL